MKHYLLLVCCPYLNGNRKVNSCRRPRYLYSYLIWALWLSHMCPVQKWTQGFISSLLLSTQKTHEGSRLCQELMGIELSPEHNRDWTGKNLLHVMWNPSESHSATDMNNIICIYPQADTFAESPALKLQRLKHHFSQKQIQ